MRQQAGTLERSCFTALLSHLAQILGPIQETNVKYVRKHLDIHSEYAIKRPPLQQTEKRSPHCS
jgi:hypothetical protein